MIAIAPRDLALLVGITLLWGVNVIVSKIGLQDIPPILFTFLRFLGLGILLLPMLRVRRGKMSAVIVAGVLSVGLNFALNFSGLAIAENVSSVAIVSQLGVPFTTLLSVALLDEVVRWRRWTGIALAFLGVIIMVADPSIGGHWQSVALVVASAFVSSLGLIAVKKLRGFRPLELQAWFSWVSVPLLLASSLIIERPTFDLLANVSAQAWWALAFTTIGASLIAHTGFYHLVRRYPVTSVAPLTILSPLFSILFGVVFLHDHLSSRILIGGACTLAGVVIITLRERRIADTGS
jgi:O-acetylserine/cysteine efflux transporter